LNWPGAPIVIRPPNAQLAVQLLVSAGIPPTSTVGEPGFHGPAGKGVQACGVRTPSAAEVAAATAGFAKDMHIPNGLMFAWGTMSMMFAAGGPPALTLDLGSTVSCEGAAPKVQVSNAPDDTCSAMSTPQSGGQRIL